jgi:hypothetical protein
MMDVIYDIIMEEIEVGRGGWMGGSRDDRESREWEEEGGGENG